MIDSRETTPPPVKADTIPVIERQLLLHLMSTPHAVHQVPTESLSPLAEDFVERLTLAPTLALHIGVPNVIFATMDDAMREGCELLDLVRELDEAPIDELRSLPRLHSVLAEIEGRYVQDPAQTLVLMTDDAPPPRTPLERLGALSQWRKEVSRGDSGQVVSNPSTWKYDALWRAACHEASALEFERMGLYAAAEEAMTSAARALSPKWRAA